MWLEIPITQGRIFVKIFISEISIHIFIEAIISFDTADFIALQGFYVMMLMKPKTAIV